MSLSASSNFRCLKYVGTQHDKIIIHLIYSVIGPKTNLIRGASRLHLTKAIYIRMS